MVFVESGNKYKLNRIFNFRNQIDKWNYLKLRNILFKCYKTVINEINRT